MKKKKKIILSIVAVVLALAAYGYFFGVQTVCAVSARMMRQPGLDVVPKPMTLDSCSKSVTPLKAFDYSFSVPWSNCFQITEITSLVVWACSESNFCVTCFSPIEGSYISFPPDQSSEDAEYRQMMIEWLGLGLKNVANINFYICKKVWELTPGDISLFESKREVIAKSRLLLLKAVACGFLPWRDIYFFEHGDIKGLQFGNPAIGPVQLSIFDQTDRDVCLTFFAFTNSPVPLTQADINTIITTFSSKP